MHNRKGNAGTSCHGASEEEEVKSPSNCAKVVVRVVTLTMTINYAQNAIGAVILDC